MGGYSRLNTLIRAGLLAAPAALEACAFHPSDKPEDRAITARVEASLQHYPALQTPNFVTVQTLGRVVYLRGLVSTPYQQQLAGEVAARAAPGLHVVNIIAIDNIR
jgi:osmotically-inducible protein OsmY